MPRIDKQLEESNILGEHNKQKDNIMLDLKTQSFKDENTLLTSILSENPESAERKADKKEVVSEIRELTLEKLNNQHQISDSLPTYDLTQYRRSPCSDKLVEKTSESTGLSSSLNNSFSDIEKCIFSANTPLSRQISEHTLDSGIHSPFSDKSEVQFQQGSDERLAPPLSTHTFRGM